MGNLFPRRTGCNECSRVARMVTSGVKPRCYSGDYAGGNAVTYKGKLRLCFTAVQAMAALPGIRKMKFLMVPAATFILE